MRWKPRPRGGRPQIETDLRALFRQMSIENPLWGAPRIHGELLKLGFEVAQSSVAKYRLTDNGRWFFVQLYRWFPTTVTWKPGTCVADFEPVGLRFWGSGVRISPGAPFPYLDSIPERLVSVLVPIAFP